MKKCFGIIIVGVIYFFIGILNVYKAEELVEKTYFEKVEIGKVQDAMLTIKIKQVEYPIYNCLGKQYILVTSLEKAGCRLYKDEKVLRIVITEKKDPVMQESINLQNCNASMYPYSVYSNNIKTYALRANGQLLIPLETLNALWDVVDAENGYELLYKTQDMYQYVHLTDQIIKNRTSYPIRVTYKDLYWDGKNIQSMRYTDQLILPNQSYRKQNMLEEKIYLTCIIESINDWKVPIAENLYGQEAIAIYQKYTDSITLRRLEKLFPPLIVKGKMKYTVGALQKDEEVEVWRIEKRTRVFVRKGNDSSIVIPYNSINIPAETFVHAEPITKQQLEHYMNLKEMQSNTNYFIWTDLARQRTYIFCNVLGEWILEKNMICSSGSNKHLTPRGYFKLLYQIPYFGMGKGYRCKYGVVIFKDYMYHSILFDKTGKYPKESVYQLGRRKSHGCIRLSEQDSKWMYENVPLDTTVWIN